MPWCSTKKTKKKKKKLAPKNPGKPMNSRESRTPRSRHLVPNPLTSSPGKRSKFSSLAKLMQVQSSEAPQKWRAKLTTKRLIKSLESEVMCPNLPLSPSSRPQAEWWWSGTSLSIFWSFLLWHLGSTCKMTNYLSKYLKVKPIHWKAPPPPTPTHILRPHTHTHTHTHTHRHTHILCLNLKYEQPKLTK